MNKFKHFTLAVLGAAFLMGNSSVTAHKESWEESLGSEGVTRKQLVSRCMEGMIDTANPTTEEQRLTRLAWIERFRAVRQKGDDVPVTAEEIGNLIVIGSVPVLTASIEEEQALVAQTRTKLEEEAQQALGKENLRKLSADKHMVVSDEDKEALRKVYNGLSRDERIAIVRGVALDKGKRVDVGAVRFGPSDDRLLRRLERRIGIKGAK